MSTASIAVPEAFRYIFGAIATARDRRKETVMGWARILAHVTATVDRDLLARNEYLATVREHQSAFQLVFQDAVFAERGSARLVIAWVARFCRGRNRLRQ